jgi:hypothetical protein
MGCAYSSPNTHTTPNLFDKHGAIKMSWKKPSQFAIFEMSWTLEWMASKECLKSFRLALQEEIIRTDPSLIYRHRGLMSSGFCTPEPPVISFLRDIAESMTSGIIGEAARGRCVAAFQHKCDHRRDDGSCPDLELLLRCSMKAVETVFCNRNFGIDYKSAWMAVSPYALYMYRTRPRIRIR